MRHGSSYAYPTPIFRGQGIQNFHARSGLICKPENAIGNSGLYAAVPELSAREICEATHTVTRTLLTLVLVCRMRPHVRLAACIKIYWTRHSTPSLS